MISPEFTFDSEMNGYVSEPFGVTEHALVHIELAKRAPVVTLRQEADGGWANYGQSPESHEGYEIEITCKDELQLMLATPVEVTKCWVIN